MTSGSSVKPVEVLDYHVSGREMEKWRERESESGEERKGEGERYR